MQIRIPRPECSGSRETLSGAFELHAKEAAPRFNEGYGALRQAWDEAVVRAIPSADAGRMRRWAELLAEEPVCTGRAKDTPRPQTTA